MAMPGAGAGAGAAAGAGDVEDAPRPVDVRVCYKVATIPAFADCSSRRAPEERKLTVRLYTDSTYDDFMDQCAAEFRALGIDSQGVTFTFGASELEPGLILDTDERASFSAALDHAAASTNPVTIECGETTMQPVATVASYLVFAAYVAVLCWTAGAANPFGGGVFHKPASTLQDETCAPGTCFLAPREAEWVVGFVVAYMMGIGVSSGLSWFFSVRTTVNHLFSAATDKCMACFALEVPKYETVDGNTSPWLVLENLMVHPVRRRLYVASTLLLEALVYLHLISGIDGWLVTASACALVVLAPAVIETIYRVGAALSAEKRRRAGGAGAAAAH